MAPLPDDVMNLLPCSELPRGERWCYQPKFDGHRMLGQVALQGVNLITRGGNNDTDKYPIIAQQLPVALQGYDAIVDGEMIGLDSEKHEDLNELRHRLPRAVYYIFDLLELDGEDLVKKPLRERLNLLNSTLKEQPRIRLTPTFYDLDDVLESARKLNYEGLVAKSLSSQYRPRYRGQDWQKLRFRKHEGFHSSENK